VFQFQNGTIILILNENTKKLTINC